MNLGEALTKYNAAGMDCLPTSKDKSPFDSGSWPSTKYGESSFENAFGIGIKCGRISGGLECLDFDNHFGDAKEILTAFMKMPWVEDVFKRNYLPIEKSMSGGYHVVFRCTENEGNLKLASRLNDKGKSTTLIETRGEGGYFCAFPTPGYTVLKNDIFKIYCIQPEEREILISAARSFNEVAKPVPKRTESRDHKYGDWFESQSWARDLMIQLLESHGWTRVTDTTWRRPGKDKGVSASMDMVGKNVFHCFTTNGDPFTDGWTYDPFDVFAILEHGGDFTAAAAAVAKMMEEEDRALIPVHPPVKKEVAISDLDKILLEAHIDTKVKIDKPPTILEIKEISVSRVEYKRIFTLGNFSCITGKAKSRKTFLISLLTACTIENGFSERFKSTLPSDRKLVMYFDTEQGMYDCHNVIRRIESMADTHGNLKAFSLRKYSPKERCTIIEHAFKLYGNQTSLCVIDGIADLANAINDEDEATRVSTMMLRLTNVYNCHIVTVIHQNKGDNFATGHLGSSIMKKAEMLISVEKATDFISHVKCEMSRGVGFDEFGVKIDENGLPRAVDVKVKQKNKVDYEYD